MNKENTGILRIYYLLTMMSAVLILSVDAAVALDIHNITITVTEYRLGGVPDSDPYEFSCGVTGDDITAVTVTTPGNVVYDLEAWTTAQYNWGFSHENLTLAELGASFPTNDYYIFTFNGGADSVTLYHNPTVPSGFANITNPVNNSTNVPLNPTFTWNDCSTYGEALMMAVGEEEGDMIGFVWLGDISMTSWTVGPLNPGLLHWLEVSVYTGTTPSVQYTGLGDDFNYYDYFENCSEVLFTTITTAIPVEIDIKPGSDPNPINPGSSGLVPVAIFSSPEFDATQVDPTSVSLAGASVAVRGKGKSMDHVEDVNADGLLDIVVQVETQGFDGLGAGGTVELTGTTFGGVDIVGYDEIIIVPPE